MKKKKKKISFNSFNSFNKYKIYVYIINEFFFSKIINYY